MRDRAGVARPRLPVDGRHHLLAGLHHLARCRLHKGRRVTAAPNADTLPARGGRPGVEPPTIRAIHLQDRRLSPAYDPATVEAFDQSGLDDAELEGLFLRYFEGFPWYLVDRSSIGMDVGAKRQSLPSYQLARRPPGSSQLASIGP